MSESKSRRTRRGDASDAAGIKVRTSQLEMGCLKYRQISIKTTKAYHQSALTEI